MTEPVESASTNHVECCCCCKKSEETSKRESKPLDTSWITFENSGLFYGRKVVS